MIASPSAAWVARVGAACMVAWCTAGCTGEARPESGPHVALAGGETVIAAAFTVDTSTVQLPLELPAQLYAEHDAVVVARSAGTIDSLYAELGDHVRAGQLLARLESEDQRIALASAEAILDNATRTAVRARTLAQRGFATPADSEQAEFRLRESDIERRKALRELELTRIASPFAGVVTVRLARPRRFVAIGDTLFRVTEQAPLFARVRVPESSARTLQVGDAATVVAASGYSSAAAIVNTAPFVDAGSGTREVVLRVAGSSGAMLAGGSVMVRVGSETKRVTSVPRTAIAPGGYAVVIENGRSTLRPVTLGRDIGGGRVEVVSGLSPGERLARPDDR